MSYIYTNGGHTEFLGDLAKILGVFSGNLSWENNF